MQSNQLQNDLSAIGRAQAQTDAELDMRRNGLAREYELQKQQLMAESAYNRNAALYNELVRNDAAKRQQEQFQQQMNLQMMQMELARREALAKAAKKAKKAKKAKGGFDDTPTVITTRDDAISFLQELGIKADPMTRQEWIRRKKGGGNEERIPEMFYDTYEKYLSDFVAAKTTPG